MRQWVGKNVLPLRNCPDPILSNTYFIKVKHAQQLLVIISIKQINYRLTRVREHRNNGRRNIFTCQLNCQLPTVGGRTLVVSSAYWSINFFQNHNRYALLIFLRGRQDQIRKFSILMYTSRLLPTSVHDFWRKSMYVRASDFWRTEAISRRKNAQNR